MGKRRFYRVETWSHSEGGTVGGALSVVQTMIYIAAGVPAEAVRNNDTDRITRIVNKEKNKGLQKYILSISELAAMPVPKIYEYDKENCRCLYTSTAFNADRLIWSHLNYIVQTVSNYNMELQWKALYIEKSRLLYEDPWQTVISKEEYERHNSALHQFESIERM